MTIYVLSGFNNYYNRQVKKFDTLEEYMPYELHTQENYNFVPNDGVNTQVVLGNVGNKYTGQGDYLLVVDEFSQIVSRWFVIESARDRAGQYTLTLHRDLVADHLEELMDAPMFIEKATVTDQDPAIYNKEGVSVNQIKTAEYLLKDDSQCAWLVGYFSREYAGGDQIEITYSNPTVDIKLSDGQTINDFVNINRAYRQGLTELSFNYSVSSGQRYRYYKATLNNKSYQWKIENTGIGMLIIYPIWESIAGSGELIKKQQEVLNNAKPFTVMQQASAYFNNGTSFDRNRFYEVANLNGKIVESNDGLKKYKLTVVEESKEYSIDINGDVSSIDNIASIKTYLTQKINANSGTPTFKLKWVEECVYITYKDVSFETFTFTFPSEANRVHLNDAPYDMFCIPYKEGGLKINLYNTLREEDNKLTTMDSMSALTAAQSLAEKMGTNLIDLQLLPFCPLQGWSINSYGEFEKAISVKPDTYVSNEVVYSTQSGFTIFFSTSSSGSYNSSQLHLIDPESNEELPLPLPIGNKKISNECDVYILCSPNYNGQFQFSESKLDGITGFNVDYTYLPYNPYIHVNPNFQGLYGKDFNDARGLICQGDFSISYMSDKWEQYQIENKNYLNMFNRDKKHLEVSQEVERDKQVFSAITGTIMGSAGGALAGSKGGTKGTIAGTITGTLSSALGGLMDVAYGDMLREEALNYKQDMFNYQMGNIQAMPDSVARTTAYTVNNKIFPILEYYTCTGIEKKAIANKIAWNGMTVGRIGTIGEFVRNNWSYDDIESKGYIKGKLIRLETIDDDYHLVNALSGELDKGVYIK